jgi:hypothetical protein
MIEVHTLCLIIGFSPPQGAEQVVCLLEINPCNKPGIINF